MSTAVENSSFAADWERWHAEREDALRESHGWLSFTALHWLTAEPAALNDLPGLWSSDGESATLTATATEGLAVEGTRVNGSIRLTPVEGAPGTLVTVGGRVVEVALRTGSHAVRVRDPQAPALAAFTGVPAYAPNANWLRQAVFAPYEVEATITTGAVIPGLRHHHRTRGTLAFTAPDGSEHTLVAFGGKDSGLSVLFTDATSGVTTYAACRVVAVPEPGADGTTTLDFTRAANLPCAFTEFATCPVAPPENRLSIAVEAGELLP